MKHINFVSILLLAGSIVCSAKSGTHESISYYKQKPADPEAVYSTSGNYGITADGKSDVTEALQGAINKMKLEQNFGIIFIPEGLCHLKDNLYSCCNKDHRIWSDSSFICSHEEYPWLPGPCSNLMFANLYMFRVIRFKTPYPYSVRTWDCKNLEFLNVHNYSQMGFIHIPERPNSIAFGGKDRKILFVTGREAFYMVK